MRGIFYRSDTRHPDVPGNIFKNGFVKRDGRWQSPRLIWRSREKAPDIVPSSGVCVTRHFEAAAIFPVTHLKADSWIYVLDLEVGEMLNTQQAQYDYVQKVGNLGSRHALWPMFGQERAVNRVNPQDIVGAVHVERSFNGRDVFHGGNFLPKSYLRNSRYKGPAATAALAEKLIQPLVEAGQWIPMPTRAQGVVKSKGAPAAAS